MININIFGDYEIEWENKYCYINEDGDHTDGIVRDTKVIDGGRLAEIIAKEMMDNDFLELTIKENEIYIGKFDPTDGTCDDITIKIKEIKKKEIDFDTWLESQPEGTFVQGGGLDGDFSKNNDKKD